MENFLLQILYTLLNHSSNVHSDSEIRGSLRGLSTQFGNVILPSYKDEIFCRILQVHLKVSQMFNLTSSQIHYLLRDKRCVDSPNYVLLLFNSSAKKTITIASSVIASRVLMKFYHRMEVFPEKFIILELNII